MGEREPSPSADATTCPECGESLPSFARFCHGCGTDVTTTGSGGDGASFLPFAVEPFHYRVVGLLSAGTAVVAVPIVFGPIGLYCALRLRRLEEDRWAAIVGVASVLGTIIGVALGVYAYLQMQSGLSVPF